MADKDGDGLVTTGELYEYVYDNVSRQARLVGGSMHAIYKGSIRGRIFLTQYETEVQKKATELLARAESFYKTGNFDKAYDLWQEVIKLLPEHGRAKQGIIKIENKRQEKREKQQQILDNKKRCLFEHYQEGSLPPNEYDVAINLVLKEADQLSESERQILKFIDDLIENRISVSTNLINIEFLRKLSERKQKKFIQKSKPPKKQ